MSHISRRLVGVAVVILALGLGRLGFALVSELASGYPVTAELGVAGSGLGSGSDVKMRGVPVGSVTSVDFRGGRAVALLNLDSDQRVPQDVDVVITAKTLLGTKQVELRPGGPLAPPYLDAGDTISADPEDFPTEVQEVLAEVERVFDDIPPGRLATLVDALGAFDRDDARTIATNIAQGRRLADFGARTADEAIERLSALADLAEALAPHADDFNRLNRTLPRWTTLIDDRQAGVRAGLNELSEFSIGLAEFLEVERDTINGLLATSQQIGAVIEPRVEEIGRFVFGLYRYMRAFGEHGGSLTDGSEHTWFRAHLGNEGELARLCGQLPPAFQQAAPGCVRDGG